MNHTAININKPFDLPGANEAGGLRRSCLVCRIMGIAIALFSAGSLVYSGVMSLDIGLFSAFLLFWALGGGITLIILSISALRQTPPPQS